MNRKSSALMKNPWLTGATCCCACSAGWNTGRPIGESVIAIIVSTAQRFAERERRHVNGCFLFIVSSHHCIAAQTHTQLLRTLVVSGSFLFVVEFPGLVTWGQTDSD